MNAAWVNWSEEGSIQTRIDRLGQVAHEVERLLDIDTIVSSGLPHPESHLDVEAMRQAVCEAAAQEDRMGALAGHLTYLVGVMEGRIEYLRRSWLCYVAGTDSKVPNTRIEAFFDTRVDELFNTAYRDGREFLAGLTTRLRWLSQAASRYDRLL